MREPDRYITEIRFTDGSYIRPTVSETDADYIVGAHYFNGARGGVR